MARKEYDNPQLDMTPMIDVVFELIIFFVINIQQEDLFTKLNANRPSPNPDKSQEEVVDTTIKIQVGANGMLAYNGRGVSLEGLKRNIEQAAKIDKKTTILVQCTLNSRHGTLVEVLDICAGSQMHNISIFSM